MQQNAYIVTGLGYGDEGKGSVVDWLTVQHDAHTVIRTGGPQALHRVVSSDGREHVFSQFGSGTLRGAATHLSKHMLIAPSALLREGEILQEKCGHNVYDRLTLHKDSLIVTPVQAVTGRVRELLRGAQKRGSVGVGVGETVRDADDSQERVLRTHDLYSPDLVQKLTELWYYKLSQYESYADRSSGLPKQVGEAVRAQLSLLVDDMLLQQTIVEFGELAKRTRMVDDQYVAEKILARAGTIVCEGSQGVLLDRVHGFYPHTTKVRSTPEAAQNLLVEGGYVGEVCSLGILRSYATRHGYGPFVTEDAVLTQELPDAENHTDPWQGNFRVGHFDAVAARYAIAACGSGAIDGLVITCLDRTADRDIWSICTQYQQESIILPDDTVSNLEEHKKNYGDQLHIALGQCQPTLRCIDQKHLSKTQCHQLQIQTITEYVGIPVYAVSTGVTEKDKYLHS